jgi:ssDNA-binding replication factor A large subunit
MDGNYERVVEKIAKKSGLPKEEIERKVEAKRAKLSGLISKEGAAQVISAELGINFEGEQSKIDELLPGMRKVNVLGKVINMFPVRSFVRNGNENKVVNFVIADETGNCRVVLWDTNHIELVEKEEIKVGTVVEIKNASSREGEIHLGSFSEISPVQKEMENVQTEAVLKEKNIEDFRVMDKVKSRAFVVQAFDPRFFNVCSECKKKVEMDGSNFVCKEHGTVPAEKRALINLVIDDGTESIRAVLFHDTLSSVGLTDFDNSDSLIQQKMNLLGEEKIFVGNVRMNSYFNTPEFIVESVEDLDLDCLISKIEENAN